MAGPGKFLFFSFHITIYFILSREKKDKKPK